MIYFHAKQQQQFLWHAGKGRMLVRSLRAGCPHGQSKPQEAPWKWPLGSANDQAVQKGSSAWEEWHGISLHIWCKEDSTLWQLPGWALLRSSTAAGISIPMCTIWVTKKRRWKPQWRWKSLIWSLSLKFGWMNHMIGTLQLMAMDCSWGTEAEGLALYLNRWIDCTDLSLKSSNAQVRSLWVKIRDQNNKRNLVAGI